MLGRVRRWVPLAVLVFACNASGRSWCEGPSPVRLEQAPLIAEATAASTAALPIIGERVVVRDGALGTSWRAVEAGAAGMEATRSDELDPEAKDPFRFVFGLEAEREDTKARGHIEVAVTFVPGDDGPKPVAIELESVDTDDARGGPTYSRTFWACPHGGELHYSRWAKGQSPCHHEPLVPVLVCGCDDNIEHVDASDCKDSGRTALKKSACARDDGVPVPPP